MQAIGENLDSLEISCRQKRTPSLGFSDLNSPRSQQERQSSSNVAHPSDWDIRPCLMFPILNLSARVKPRPCLLHIADYLETRSTYNKTT